MSCETFPFLVNLVANLGPRLRSTTLLSHARRVRHGRITTEDALLFKHCHVPDYLITRLNDYVHREREGADEYGIPDQLTKSSANHSDLLNVLISDRDHTESPNLFTSLQICSKLGAPSNYVASQISTHLTPVWIDDCQLPLMAFLLHSQLFNHRQMDPIDGRNKCKHLMLVLQFSSWSFLHWY